MEVPELLLKFALLSRKLTRFEINIGSIFILRLGYSGYSHGGHLHEALSFHPACPSGFFVDKTGLQTLLTG